MGPPPPPVANRRRQTSLSESRSAPDLARLDPSGGQSPAITVDGGTPVSIVGSGTALPSPPLSRDDNPRLSSDGYADGEQEDGDEEDDEDFADFLIGSDAEDLEGSSGSSSASSTSSSRRSSTSKNPPVAAAAAAASSVRRSQSTTGTASTSGTVLGRSQSHVQLTSFAPPFYNRPPLPLPPSPSLTSLLRPSFSATPSRPTTPDDSENDTPNDTEAGVAKAARTATTVPRAAPKVPTYEYYGFVLYLTSGAVLLMYVLWSFLPSPFLHALGITYYPNRWWSLAIPAQLVASLAYVYVALACYNTEVLTLPLTHPGCFVDEAAYVAVLDVKGKILRDTKPDPNAGAAAGTATSSPKSAKEEKSSAGKGSSDAKRRKRDKRENKERDRAEQERLARIKHVVSSHQHRPNEDATVAWDWRMVWSEGTDAVMDVPIGGVCEILYGNSSP